MTEKTQEMLDEDLKKGLKEIEALLDEPLEKPADRFELVLENMDNKHLFMSSGLLRKLVTLVEGSGGDTLENSKIFLDPELQNQICVEVLVGRSLYGDELYNARLEAQKILDEHLTIDEGERFTAWLREHVLHFFMNSLKTLFKQGINEKGAYQRLMLSLNGLGLLQQQKQ